MSRTAARQQITWPSIGEATAHVECRKDAGVIDESPAAYSDIDAVMAAQSDLMEIVHTAPPGAVREGMSHGAPLRGPAAPSWQTRPARHGWAGRSAGVAVAPWRATT